MTIIKTLSSNEEELEKKACSVYTILYKFNIGFRVWQKKETFQSETSSFPLGWYSQHFRFNVKEKQHGSEIIKR